MFKQIKTTAILILALAIPTAASALSPGEQAQLQRLLEKRSVEVLGPRPNNFRGFSQTGHISQSPCRGRSRVMLKRHDGQAHGTFQRWKCGR